MSPSPTLLSPKYTSSGQPILLWSILPPSWGAEDSLGIFKTSDQKKNWKLLSHVQLCDPMDCSPPDSSVHGILQTRILEWAAISFPRESSQLRDWTQVSHITGRFFTVQVTMKVLLSQKWSEVKSLSHVRLFATPWTVAYKAPLSMEFSRQEYWSGLEFPSPGDLPDSGIELGSPALQADALPSEPPGKTRA